MRIETRQQCASRVTDGSSRLCLTAPHHTTEVLHQWPYSRCRDKYRHQSLQVHAALLFGSVRKKKVNEPSQGTSIANALR